MFQLRDTTDPWANVADTSLIDSFKSMFDFSATPDVTDPALTHETTSTQTPGPTTIRPGVSPIPATKPWWYPAWYKTPIGIGMILLGAFVGYKIYTRKK